MLLSALSSTTFDSRLRTLSRGWFMGKFSREPDVIMDAQPSSTYRLTLIRYDSRRKVSNDHAHSTATADLSDLDLIRSYQVSQSPAFVSQLMQRYSGHIVAFSMDHFQDHEYTKDFTNDIFIKLCDKLKKERITNFKNWLYVFMKNMFYDIKRREKLHSVYVDQQPKQEEYSIERQLQHQLDHPHLHAAMKELSEQERKCLRLIYLEDKRYAEIIQETGWTFNQIRGLRDRATGKLRALVTDELKQTYP